MFQLPKISVFFIIALVYLISSAKAENSFPVQKFVSNLVSSFFSNCSLLILHEIDNSYGGESLNKLISEIGKTAYVLRIDGKKKTSNGTKSSIHFPINLSNIRKQSSVCMVGILFVNQVEKDLMIQIQSVLAPTYLPIIRKDQDYFVFITRPQFHKRLLLMREFPARIKFKIAVGTVDNGKLVISTVDFFGGVKATPVVIRLPEWDKKYWKKLEYFPDFLWNLKGKILRISIPWVYSKAEAKLPWDGIKNAKRGHWKYLLEEYLMVKLNFSYTMFVSTGIDGKFGGGGTGLQLKNGMWIGTTGDLYYGRADLGFVTAKTDKRIKYIGFTDTYYDTGGLTFVTGQPTRVYSSLALLWPFTFKVWTSLLFVVVIGLGFLYIVFKFPFLEDSWPLSKQIPILLVPFVEQDYFHARAIVSASLRCFFTFWSFFAIIITTLYRSKLVTLLAFPVLGKLPVTFEQLAFSDFQVAFMKHGDSALNTLKSSNDTVYINLLKKLEIITGVGLECLEKAVREDSYACIAYDFDVSHLQGRNFSEADSRKILGSNTVTYQVWLGVATEAYSIFRVNFGKVLGNTRPFHLASVWEAMDMYENVKLPKLRWWRETNQNQVGVNGDKEEQQNLTLKHIKGAFFMWICSVCLSLVGFCCEVFTARLMITINDKVSHKFK